MLMVVPQLTAHHYLLLLHITGINTKTITGDRCTISLMSDLKHWFAIGSTTIHQMPATCLTMSDIMSMIDSV